MGRIKDMVDKKVERAASEEPTNSIPLKLGDRLSANAKIKINLGKEHPLCGVTFDGNGNPVPLNLTEDFKNDPSLKQK
jgi:hypothetical protein